MSYHVKVPAIFTFSVRPFEFATDRVRNAGVLLFSSAGNDGEDIDDETCFLFICVEDDFYCPAENDGVICVAGYGNDGYRAPGSNYGSEDVAIYAPYNI